MRKKDFNVSNGKLYSLLETKDYGEIVFGCPPGIVKEFIKTKLYKKLNKYLNGE